MVFISGVRRDRRTGCMPAASGRSRSDPLRSVRSPPDRVAVSVKRCGAAAKHLPDRCNYCANRSAGAKTLFRSKTIQVQNSIDQFFMEDNGKKYLFWGSFRGIYGIELSGDGLSVRDGAKKKQVAGTAYEGTYIHKRGDYYYLFASIGSCCEGLKSTYTTVVGRSDSLFGPYTDKQGRPMMENHHEVLIHGNDAFVGTGHNSEIVTDDRGNDWVLYHAVSREHPTGRVLMLDRIRWRDGWPEVEGASPSLEAEAPEFIN